MPSVNIRIVKEVIASDPAGKKAPIVDKAMSAITEGTRLGISDVWAA